jgi:hypothetical protein
MDLRVYFCPFAVVPLRNKAQRWIVKMGPLATVSPSIDVVLETAPRLVLLYGQAEAAVGACDGFWRHEGSSSHRDDGASPY